MENIQITCARCRKIVQKSVKSKSKDLCKECTTKKTKLEKYGDEKYYNTSKFKETCLKKYGVDNPQKDESIKRKTKETCIQKYGGVLLGSDIITRKIENTCLKIYGKKRFQNTEQFKNFCKQQAIDGCIENMLDVQRKKYGGQCFVNSPEGMKYRHQLYFFEGEKFDSSWELAYWVYCKDHNINIKRNYEKFQMRNGKWCYFDFIVDGNFVEIKGDHLKNHKDWEYKSELYLIHNVKVMSEKDMTPFMNYIYEIYGKSFIRDHKIKKLQNSRSNKKIIPINNIDDIYSSIMINKKQHPKFSYNCEKCGSLHISSFYILDHFKNLLCKKCRKL